MTTNEEPERTDLTDDDAATDPGSVSEVAATTTSEAAEAAQDAGAPSYATEPEGTESDSFSEPGAGRIPATGVSSTDDEDDSSEQ